ncbi:hypothetical protein ACPOL_2768 [Acidisarcina polymorpha]|uniref:Uncharacterized protein n=1 Tax=Acidisarcina polymorpha TaxID=2211140 RepID=A0A2Z5FYY7_9BACT|nr:hypothetical protein ACPOL_2768 [Acidisarcina polymorpha]
MSMYLYEFQERPGWRSTSGVRAGQSPDLQKAQFQNARWIFHAFDLNRHGEMELP